MSEEEEDYVYRREVNYKKVKIPEGCVKCPTCNGSGEIRRYYGSPWDRGQFQACVTCGGSGYVSESYLELHRKIFGEKR